MKSESRLNDKAVGSVMGVGTRLGHKGEILNMTDGLRSFAGQLKAVISGSSTMVVTAKSSDSTSVSQ
jgi:hypothetical protein